MDIGYSAKRKIIMIREEVAKNNALAVIGGVSAEEGWWRDASYRQRQLFFRLFL